MQKIVVSRWISLYTGLLRHILSNVKTSSVAQQASVEDIFTLYETEACSQYIQKEYSGNLCVLSYIAIQRDEYIRTCNMCKTMVKDCYCFGQKYKKTTSQQHQTCICKAQQTYMQQAQKYDHLTNKTNSVNNSPTSDVNCVHQNAFRRYPVWPSSAVSSIADILIFQIQKTLLERGLGHASCEVPQ